MADTVSGTFTATGPTAETTLTDYGRVKLSEMSGNTIVLEEYSEAAGGFIPTGDTYLVGGVFKISGGGQKLRLNCTVFSTAQTYDLIPVDMPRTGR